VLSPLVFPFRHEHPYVRACNQGLLRRSIRRFMRNQSFERPIVWSYHPFILETIRSFNISSLIYHCVDDMSAIPGIDTNSFNTEERRFLSKANLTFVTSQALFDKCSEYNAHTHYFPNVADASHFSRALDRGEIPADLQKIPQPRIGYVGVLSDFKVDFILLRDLAERKPQWHFVLIGEEREGQSSPVVQHLRTLANVHFLGYRAYHVLPDYLRGFDVALLPTLLNDYTRAMFPMKYFEYLAAGLPIVSTPLEFTRNVGAGIEIGMDAEGFEHAIEKQLRRGKMTASRASDCVGENTWDARMDRMLELVESQT